MRIAAAIAALAAALCAGGCERAPRDHERPSAESPPVSAPADPPASASSPALAEMSVAELRERAAVALRERRLHSPDGDNALELYLQARERAPDNPAIANAVQELLPYVLIACEQAIARADFAEAQRLLALLGRGDPDAPALARLRATLRDAQARAEAAAQAEAARLAESEARRLAAERAAASAAPAAPASMPAQTPASAPAAVDARPAVAATPRPTIAAASPPPRPAAGVNTASPPADAAPAATAAAAASSPQSGETQTGTSPRLIRQASPRYPLIAMNRRIEGQVEVAFTVQPDGSVRNARVVSAEPAGVFDRAALAAVQAYRFAPSERSHETRRTLNFRLDGND